MAYTGRLNDYRPIMTCAQCGVTEEGDWENDGAYVARFPWDWKLVGMIVGAMHYRVHVCSEECGRAWFKEEAEHALP